MSNLTDHAERELRAAGLFDKDSDYDGMLGPAVLELVRAFADQGHSGASAGRTLALFSKVAAFKPLLPLTGADDEWMEVEDGVWQNRRCSHVFNGPKGAYDLNGRIFREPSGVTYTSRESLVPVTFPYTPKSEIVDVPKPAEEPSDAPE